MAKNTIKKVLLFIVEGANDEAALGMPLENLQKTRSMDNLIRLGVTHGDITCDKNVRNIAHKVSDCVKEYCTKYKLDKTDICEVALLIDMDGAYISDDARIQSDKHAEAYYDEDVILHSRLESLQMTHKRKRKHVNNLVGLKHVLKNIPFSIYFVSCNFDHIICGNANLNNREKSIAADNFSLKYSEDANGFFTFFHTPEFTLGTTYEESWNAIKQGTNSLQRYSNLNVFLAKHYPDCET